jgi:type IX secretion system PorP/SprF family membrane protein
MRKILLLLLLVGSWGQSAFIQAQQQPMYTLYMFNQLAYNPAYAGSANALDVSLLHRHQWWGFGANAPMTQSLTMHKPLREKNIALGLNVNYDRIAVSNSFSVFPSFAYRMKFGDPSKNGGYISLGLQGGISNFTADWSQLNLDDPNDPAFQVQRPNVWLPNFGTGIYVHTKTWYVGFSCPMLITNSLRKRTSLEPADLPIAQQFRHYFLSAGMAFKINSDLVFRPTLLIKNVGLFVERNQLGRIGAPTEFDIDLALLVKKSFWFGVSFRSAFELGSSSFDSVDFWALLRLKNGLGIGVAYDYTLTPLMPTVQGSYEVMLRYDLIRSDADGGTSEGKFDHVRYF